MKISKTLFIIISVSSSIILQHVHAQTLIEFKKMAPPQKAKIVADSLKTALHLGDKQYPKVYNILLEGTEKAQPIIKSDCNKISKGYKLKNLLAEEEVKLQSILTKYQYQLYQQKKEALIAWVKSHKKEKEILMEKI